jgi:hypothetical protein
VDVLSDAASTVKKQTQTVLSETAKVAVEASDKMSTAMTDLVKSASGAIDATGDAALKVIEGGKDLVQRKRADRRPPADSE